MNDTPGEEVSLSHYIEGTDRILALGYDGEFNYALTKKANLTMAFLSTCSPRAECGDKVHGSLCKEKSLRR